MIYLSVYTLYIVRSDGQSSVTMQGGVLLSSYREFVVSSQLYS